MRGEGVFFVLGDYGASEADDGVWEEDVPELALAVQAGEVAGFEVD
jgi:hypothetical protein